MEKNILQDFHGTKKYKRRNFSISRIANKWFKVEVRLISMFSAIHPNQMKIVIDGITRQLREMHLHHGPHCLSVQAQTNQSLELV